MRSTAFNKNSTTIPITKLKAIIEEKKAKRKEQWEQQNVPIVSTET
jgi:hypothetical protein